jgi:hypothetical protein
MSESLRVEFQVGVLVAGEWLWRPVDDLLGHADGLVDQYLQIENLHCCDFQGGFFIEVDGRPWNDAATVDEFWMTMTWFYALREILLGKPSAKAFPWEESQLVLARRGSRLEIEDWHHAAGPVCPKVALDLADFTRQMLREGRKFGALMAEVQAEVTARCQAAQGDYRSRQKLYKVRGNLPPDTADILAELEKLLAPEA